MPNSKKKNADAGTDHQWTGPEKKRPRHHSKLKAQKEERTARSRGTGQVTCDYWSIRVTPGYQKAKFWSRVCQPRV